MAIRLGFSSAAATRSLSFSCLLTASSVECVPGVTNMSNYNQGMTNSCQYCKEVIPVSHIWHVYTYDVCMYIYGVCMAKKRTLKRGGRTRSSFTLMHRPMSVAMVQCCTVGVNWTLVTAVLVVNSLAGGKSNLL